jgi:DNA modification methylase
MVAQMRQDLPVGLKQQIQAAQRARRKGRSNEVDFDSLSHIKRNDPAPTLKLEAREPEALKPAKRRVRRSSPEQLQRVMRAMAQLGCLAPPLINACDEIIDGHIVVEAAQRLGVDEIQCLIAEHLSADEERLARIALNRLAETGEWDAEMLALDLRELASAGFDLQTSGFDALQIDHILGISIDEIIAGDKIGDPPISPVTRPGDLWVLGKHKLFCGDARLAASYEHLLDHEKVQCVFSDPPYNIKIEGVVSGLGKVKHSDFAMACGEMTDDGFRSFLTAYLDRCREHCVTGAVIFACMDWRQIDLLLLAGRDAGLQRLNKIIWNKGSGGMGGLYRSAYEEIVVFGTAKASAVNNVQLGRHGRDRTNVWTYPGANKMGSSAKKALKDHPTPKPVELVADAMLDVTRRGDVVLDPFMGSGTTIMACEYEERLGRGIEFDPAYVDVAIRRWEEATGKQARHTSLGLTFSEVGDQRRAESAAAHEEVVGGQTGFDPAPSLPV